MTKYRHQVGSSALKANSVKHVPSDLATVLFNRSGVKLKRILIFQHFCFSSFLILHKTNIIYYVPSKSYEHVVERGIT